MYNIFQIITIIILLIGVLTIIQNSFKFGQYLEKHIQFNI